MRLGMSVTLQWMVITVEWMLKSQHRKSSLEKKIHPPLLMGLEPADFQSWVWNFTNGLSLLPRPQPVSLPARPNQSQRITDILLLSSHTVSSTCANIHTDLLEVEQYKNSTVDYNSKQLLNCFSTGCCGWVFFSGGIKALLLIVVAHQFSVNTKLLYKLCQWGSRVRGQLVKVKDGLLTNGAPLVNQAL